MVGGELGGEVPEVAAAVGRALSRSADDCICGEMARAARGAVLSGATNVGLTFAKEALSFVA